MVYHLTAPPPVIAGTDAVLQEVETLRARFGGTLSYLYPFRRPGIHLPWMLYGLHRLVALRRQDAGADGHHVYAPQLYLYPILRWLRRPVVYSITTSLQAQRRPSRRRAFDSIHSIVVSNERDLAILGSWRIGRARLIRPGIDASRFGCSPLVVGTDFTLLAGSAPWTARQFRLKGVDALLEAARLMPNLRLVFLWRGLLLDEMRARIRAHGLHGRVEVVDEKVDVNQVLARVHAAVVLAAVPTLVKAYPHSLLESLAAGKPVLVSECIPMADYVEATGCGQVVPRLHAADLLQAIEALIDGYDGFQARAQQVGGRDFSQQAMLEAYEALYAGLPVPSPAGWQQP